MDAGPAFTPSISPSAPEGGFPFHSRGNRDIEKLRDRSWIAQPVSIRVRIQTQASEPIVLTTHNPGLFDLSFNKSLLSTYCIPMAC